MRKGEHFFFLSNPEALLCIALGAEHILSSPNKREGQESILNMKSFYSCISGCTYFKRHIIWGRRRVSAEVGLPAAFEDTGVMVAGSPQRGMKVFAVLL